MNSSGLYHATTRFIHRYDGVVFFSGFFAVLLRYFFGHLGTLCSSIAECSNYAYARSLACKSSGEKISPINIDFLFKPKFSFVFTLHVCCVRALLKWLLARTIRMMIPFIRKCAVFLFFLPLIPFNPCKHVQHTCIFIRSSFADYYYYSFAMFPNCSASTNGKNEDVSAFLSARGRVCLRM